MLEIIIQQLMKPIIFFNKAPEQLTCKRCRCVDTFPALPWHRDRYYCEQIENLHSKLTNQSLYSPFLVKFLCIRIFCPVLHGHNLLQLFSLLWNKTTVGMKNIINIHNKAVQTDSNNLITLGIIPCIY